MEHTDTKDIITEALNVLKEKIAASYDGATDGNVADDIENIAIRLTDLIEKLEEFAFNSARSSEDDEQYTFLILKILKTPWAGSSAALLSRLSRNLR